MAEIGAVSEPTSDANSTEGSTSGKSNTRSSQSQVPQYDGIFLNFYIRTLIALLSPRNSVGCVPGIRNSALLRRN